MQRIKIIFVFIIALTVGNTCYATCNEGETNMGFHGDSFKGHAVFVWKKSSDYSFVWLGDLNTLISRESVANARQVSECIVIERIKKMKGLKQLMTLFIIKDPHSHNFTSIDCDPMRSRDDFLELINRLEALAEENQVEFIIYDSQNFKSTSEGF